MGWHHQAAAKVHASAETHSQLLEQCFSFSLLLREHDGEQEQKDRVGSLLRMNFHARAGPGFTAAETFEGRGELLFNS